jgi:predicted nuclease of predicted toxin-antitoxin system
MPKSPHKFKLLLDENVEARSYFPKLNDFHNVKHLVGDYKKDGLKDPEVFEYAKKEKRILVTYNYTDFTKMDFSKNTGVIGISHALSLSDIDKKLMSFLRSKSENDLYGKVHIISGEIKSHH